MLWHEVLPIALFAACGVLLLAAAIAWRHMIGEFPRLQLWRYLRRHGITRDDASDTLGPRAAMQAALKCTLCGSARHCRERFALSAAAVPPANCPNARYFEEFGLGVQADKATLARHTQTPKSALDFTRATRL